MGSPQADNDSSTQRLRFGIIGMSEGNGHPYSWSAIINGYDPAVMEGCPFPTIPEYLARQNFPSDALSVGKVTHIYTQSRRQSEHVALATHIDNVVDDPADLIGEVDAILLARDDAENHVAMARPFIQSGLPIYIDKPLALTTADADELYRMEQWPGQVFTCSALAFASELRPPPSALPRAINAASVTASVMKSWNKYSIHIIEPVLNILQVRYPPKAVTATKSKSEVSVSCHWEDGPHSTFTVLGTACKQPIEIHIAVPGGTVTLTFRDTFTAFRNALSAFVTSIRLGCRIIDRSITMTAVDIIERGNAAIKDSS